MILVLGVWAFLRPSRPLHRRYAGEHRSAPSIDGPAAVDPAPSAPPPGLHPLGLPLTALGELAVQSPHCPARTLIQRMARENPTLYSIRPESQVRREDPFLPRKQRAEGRGGEAAKHGGPALADQRTKTPGTPGGSAPDCPGRQENGAEGSRESCPPEGRYKGNLPFLFRARACEVRRRRISALLPRSRLGGSDACGLGRR
jgi:hypothetical protein